MTDNTQARPMTLAEREAADIAALTGTAPEQPTARSAAPRRGSRVNCWVADEVAHQMRRANGDAIRQALPAVDRDLVAESPGGMGEWLSHAVAAYATMTQQQRQEFRATLRAHAGQDAEGQDRPDGRPRTYYIADGAYEAMEDVLDDEGGSRSDLFRDAVAYALQLRDKH